MRLTPASTFELFVGHDGVDLYEVLGISNRASPSEVKAAFRQLAKSLHPDCNAGNRTAEQHFAVVHYAYTVLDNAERRAAYDRKLESDRANAALRLAAAGARRGEDRRWHFWRVAAEMTVTTVVLTVCFVTGISIWQQSSGGLSHEQPVGTASAGVNGVIPPTLTRTELSEALFGSEAAQYDRDVTTARSATPPAPTPNATAPAAEQSAAPPVVAEGTAPPVVAQSDAPPPVAQNGVPRSTQESATPPAVMQDAMPESATPPAVAQDVTPESAAPPGAVQDVTPPVNAKGSIRSAATSSATAVGATSELSVQNTTPPTTAEAAAQPIAAVELPSAEPSTSTKGSRPGDLPSRLKDPSVLKQAERFISLGERYLAEGNIAIARQYFARAADLGLALAANKLAETFEAGSLARHGVVGVRPDPAEAARWRKRALELRP